MVKSLGITFYKYQQDGLIRGIKANSVKAITHQQFVDDTMLFGKVYRREAIRFKKILRIYAKALGQQINQDKSEVFFFNVKMRIEHQILAQLIFKEGKLPCLYLGFPLDKGLRSTKVWTKWDKGWIKKWIPGKKNGFIR